MTSDDLIIAAPWLVFAAGLIVIGWRLIVDRRRAAAEQSDTATRPEPDRPDPHSSSPDASLAGRDRGH